MKVTMTALLTAAGIAGISTAVFGQNPVPKPASGDKPLYNTAKQKLLEGKQVCV
jgi:hypothetical protein